MRKREWSTLGLAILAALAGLGMARPAAADPIVSTVTLAQSPTAVAVDARTDRAFVATTDPLANTSLVAVFDTASGRLLTSTYIGPNLGLNPGPLAVDERAGRLLVANGDSNSVSVLDARSGQLIHMARVVGTPRFLALDERAGHAFVGTLSNSVAELDSASGTVLHTITLSDVPTALAVDDRAGRAFVGTADGAVATIDTRSGALVRTTPLGEGVRMMAVDRRAGRLFAIVSNGQNYGAAYGYGVGGDMLCLLDTANGHMLSSISIPALSSALTLDESMGRAYVVSPLGARVSIFDSRSGAAVGAVATNWIPDTVVVDARSGHGVVVAQNGTGAITFDARSGRVLRSVSLTGAHRRLVGWQIESIALDARRGRVVMAMADDHAGQAVVLDSRSGRVTRMIPVGIVAADMDVDAGSGRVVLVGTTVTTPRPTPLDTLEESLSRVLGRGVAPLNHWLDSLARWFPFSAPPTALTAANIGSVTVLNTGAAESAR